jgi:hypothetical protein
MSETKHRINILIFQEAGGWVAQCLQYDVAAQAETVPDLFREILRALASHVTLNIERGRAPFADLGEAPDKFWIMYGEASPIDESNTIDRERNVPRSEPLPEIPRAPIDPHYRWARQPEAHW